jgi:hypothetical protein
VTRLHGLNIFRKNRSRRWGDQGIVRKCLVALAVLGMATMPIIGPRTTRAQSSCRIGSTLPLIPDVINGAQSFFQKSGEVVNYNFVFADPSIAGVIAICPGGGLTPPCNYDGFSYRPGLSSGNIQDVVAGGVCNTSWQITASDFHSTTVGWRVKFEQGAHDGFLGTPAAETFTITIAGTLADGQYSVSGNSTVTSYPDPGGN